MNRTIVKDNGAFRAESAQGHHPAAVKQHRPSRDHFTLPPALAIVTRGVLRNLAYREGWLGQFVVPSRLTRQATHAGAVMAWGYKPSSSRAAAAAARCGLPLLRLEDAFLRSVDYGERIKPLGIVFDNRGIYYDARSVSRLEALIPLPLDTTQYERARNIIACWQRSRVSKYNHAREYYGKLPEDYVLVIDQTEGDLAISSGLADAQTFRHMFECAIAENPGRQVIVKLHPRVHGRQKRGHLAAKDLRTRPGVTVLDADTHPVRLLEHAAKVYVVTSQLGFEALLWGKKVRTFGMPFYAGWGLTEDNMAAPPRRTSASLEQIAYAALVDYARYVDPETREPCEVESILAHLALQRREREAMPARIYAVGISRWKRRHVRRFLQGSTVSFHHAAGNLPPDAQVLTFGTPETGERPGGTSTICLEDGFLRSVGLGCVKTPPYSWVRDVHGIYHDPRSPSGLERILQNSPFAEPLLQRAARLCEMIISANITKYNHGRGSWHRPPGSAHVILVPGQVENDRALKYADPLMSTNRQLLERVRIENPRSIVLYKIHPDVLAGKRQDSLDAKEALHWCDEVLGPLPMADLLGQVDEIHTLSSLTGFEALLRSRLVVTYAQPFYAGWGLTEDRMLSPAVASRRTRRLGILELVAGCLILYPTYTSRRTGLFTTPETVIREIIDERNAAPASWWSEAMAAWLSR